MALVRHIHRAGDPACACHRPQLRVIQGGRASRSALIATWTLGADGKLTCRWRLDAERHSA